MHFITTTENNMKLVVLIFLILKKNPSRSIIFFENNLGSIFSKYTTQVIQFYSSFLADDSHIKQKKKTPMKLVCDQLLNTFVIL